jgi:hypothetical protein
MLIKIAIAIKAHIIISDYLAINSFDLAADRVTVT